MKRVPKLIEVSVKEFAIIANLTPQRIYQLISEGRLPAIKNGKIPLYESITALCKYYQREGEELKREKLLLVIATRKKKEEELMDSRSKYVERDVATHTCLHMAVKYKQLVITEVEKYGPLNRRDKLTQLGVPIGMIDAFHTFDVSDSQRVIDSIANECGRQEAFAVTEFKEETK